MQRGVPLLLLFAAPIFVILANGTAGEGSAPADEKAYAFEKHERWQRPRTVVGVKYDMGDCVAMPLGGLGTGPSA